MLKYDIRTGVKKIKTKTFMVISGATLASAGLLMAVAMPFAAKAATAPFQLNPFEFVGTAAECGGTAGTDTVTAQWDNSTGNPSPSILLQKLGLTSNCAAAGVDIVTPLEGGPTSALTELNYDYQNGGHCGAGAPRFNIQTDTGTAVTLGCIYGTHTDLGNGWTHVEFTAAQIQAAVATAGAGTTLQDLYIIFDEGTDTPAGGTIGTPGTVHIDNVSVNGQVVGSPTSPITKDDCKNGGWQNLVDTTGHSFKNQGDCVSYVATHGRNMAAGPLVPATATSTLGLTTGNVTLADPTQTLSFFGHDNGTSADDQGQVSYSNPGAGLTYSVPTTCVNVSGNTAFFAYQIPNNAPTAAGVWIVWKVVDGSPDSAGFTTASDMASANTLCEAGSTAVTNYTITSGDIVVQHT